MESNLERRENVEVSAMGIWMIQIMADKFLSTEWEGWEVMVQESHK